MPWALACVKKMEKSFISSTDVSILYLTQGGISELLPAAAFHTQMLLDPPYMTPYKVDISA